MHELGRAMFGIDKQVAGEVLGEHGEKITTTHGAAAAGVGYVSKNRDLESLMLRASIGYNISLPSLDLVSTCKVISARKERDFVNGEIESLSIKCQGPNQPVRALSGGNKQKVAFAKWVGRRSKILVLDCPTRGVDVGVKAYIYNLMKEAKKQGVAMVLISDELAEVLGMADRLVVMKDGKVKKVIRRDEDFTEHSVIEVMI